jgi:hypothetical protein
MLYLSIIARFELKQNQSDFHASFGVTNSAHLDRRFSIVETID